MFATALFVQSKFELKKNNHGKKNPSCWVLDAKYLWIAGNVVVPINLWKQGVLLSFKSLLLIIKATHTVPYSYWN